MFSKKVINGTFVHDLFSIKLKKTISEHLFQLHRPAKKIISEHLFRLHRSPGRFALVNDRENEQMLVTYDNKRTYMSNFCPNFDNCLQIQNEVLY